MSEPVIRIGKTQIIWNHSSALLKILVILLLVFSMVALVALNWVRISIANQTEAMRAEAAAVEAANHMTKGGVSANEKAQVLREDGSVVEGLFAGGEVTWQSGGYSQSVVFGRIAGASAAERIAAMK